MSNTIHLLTDSVANQIAAGEVVQRPASIVKELLENAIDAQSTKIILVVKGAGKTLIQVTDDGIGMNENDARLCFEPHATSKIRKSEDLFNIRTLGFRGEALSSIASVSHVVLKTKTRDSELGVEIKIEGAKFISHTPIALNKGSQFSVKNIFFNVPARRKFLKSNPVEMNHIYDEFKKIALAYPEVVFNLIVDDQEIYNLHSGNVMNRVVSLFGKKFNNNIVKVENSTTSASIFGYIGTPNVAKKTRGQQYFFVNGRFIKSYSLQSAVYQSFQYLLPKKHNPFFILYINLDTSDLDINVHPTKTEIKLQNESMIFSFIRVSVKQALTNYQISPTIDFERDVNWLSKLKPNEISQSDTNTFNSPSEPSESIESPLPRSSPSPSSWKDKNKVSNSQWQKLYQENIQFPSRTAIDEFDNEKERLNEKSDQKGVLFPSSAKATKTAENPDRNKSTVQLEGGIIVSTTSSGLLLMKQKEAHERVLFEKHLRMIKNNDTNTAQRNLFPVTVELSNEDMKLLKSIWDIVESIGFLIDEFGPRTIKISGTPMHLADVSKQNFIEDLLEQYKLEESAFQQESTQKILDDAKKQGIIIAKTLAHKGAMSSNKVLEELEMENLIGQLFSCEFPNFSLDDQPIFCIVENEKVIDLINNF